MLNKTQSKKCNSFKYALIIPVLVAFVFIFQMEVIAKEKHQNIKIEQAKSTSKDVEIYKIDKNTTEDELKEKAETISKNYGVTVHFSKTKRNASNELTSIAIEIKKGKEIAENRTVKSTEPIKAFAIIISKDENGKLKIDFAEDNESDHNKQKIVISNNLSSKNNIPDDTEIFIDDKKSDKTAMEKLDPEDIVSMNVIKNSDKKEIRIFTRKNSDKNEARITTKKNPDNSTEEEWFINGDAIIKLNNTDLNTVNSIDVDTNKKTIRIVKTNSLNSQHDKNAPVPPTPPTPPVMKAKAPAPPAMPKAPKAPKGDPVHGDKKAWKEFEKQMEEFDTKMKKMEPQMEAFDKQMAEFDKQMEPFNKQMEAFNEKMKVYEKEMEKYLSEKKDKK